MRSLKDKNFIVTGASGGIGNSIVEKLHEQGAKCFSNRNKN
jgi:3-oxoacyl-[acyl-carrier protein] reductase